MSGQRGRLIVIEGIDGAGTTTQAGAVAARLRSLGQSIHLTCEPSQGPVGLLIRGCLRGKQSLDWASLALLFAADRADHVAREVEPQLAAGTSVVCDRYVLSSLTYQAASAPPQARAEEPIAWLRSLNSRVPRPDATFVLDVPAGVAAARRAARGAPPELFERAALQRQLAANYARAERLVPEDRLYHVDGAQPAECITERIVELLQV